MSRVMLARTASLELRNSKLILNEESSDEKSGVITILLSSIGSSEFPVLLEFVFICLVM
jgi:hypothetical protein